MYTNRFINMLSFVITVSIFITMQYCIDFLQSSNEDLNMETAIRANENTCIDSSFDEEIEIAIENQEKENMNLWEIQIPKIDLVANINEGTTGDILAKSVGHFEETPIFDGNVGLAGHNRGYNMNFFERIKNLDVGDKIIYKYEEKVREYVVEKLVIIKETDWSYLEPTKDNKMTLITCVKDSPEYRLCVQGKEII